MTNSNNLFYFNTPNLFDVVRDKIDAIIVEGDLSRYELEIYIHNNGLNITVETEQDAWNIVHGNEFNQIPDVDPSAYKSGIELIVAEAKSMLAQEVDELIDNIIDEIYRPELSQSDIEKLLGYKITIV